MTSNLVIQEAMIEDAYELATMVGELLGAIMNATRTNAFHFGLVETST